MTTSSFRFFGLLTVLVFALSMVACSNDDDLWAKVTVNEGPAGDIGGDFTGNGGNTTRTITWSNNLATADYNADITSASMGNFQVIIADANGTVVLDRSLTGSNDIDTISGVTGSGEPGTWSVTINLTSFNGDGSYSLSAGN